MAFKKNGEVKVYKKGGKISPKLASKDKSNRFTIDELVSQADKVELDLTTKDSVVVQEEVEEKEDVSN